MTFRERFYIRTTPDRSFAPSTLGAPVFTNPIDYTIFKKDAKEKDEMKLIKWQHKQDLKKAYGDNIGRYLNVPGKQLDKSIVIIR